jgi:hypothetical protein
MTGGERGTKTPTQFFKKPVPGSNAGAITGNTTTRTTQHKKETMDLQFGEQKASLKTSDLRQNSFTFSKAKFSYVTCHIAM